MLASYKAATTSNVTLSVQETLRVLLDQSTVDRAEISALAIGTTHFINALIERDSSRVEKVAVLRLVSYNFSAGTPPFADWPNALKRIVNGYSAIIPGGCNIDGQLIADIDPVSVREQASIIKSKGIKNVVIVGVGSPTDHKYHHEEKVRDILKESLSSDVNYVLSRDVAGNGLLARENASILNASILNFAQRAIRSFMAAMKNIGLQCPLYLTSNSGHLLTFSEAMQFPIRIFSSGATNSIRGAAFLAGDEVGQTGCVVVDIGGTTTDVGYLLKNGYPRLAKSYTDIAGVKVNLEMPSVESVGLGGGSIIHHDADGEDVSVGPDSVGHDLLTKALSFGGSVTTATDIVVASGSATIGTHKPELQDKLISKAKLKMKKLMEACIDRSKNAPDPCMIILVGGGSILCPPELEGVSKIVLPEHAGVANAIGAAMAKISGSAELMTSGSDVEAGIAKVKEQAIQNAISRGGNPSSVTILHQEAVGVPYTDGQVAVKVEVALPADHERVRREMRQLEEQSEIELEKELFEETKIHDIATNGEASTEEKIDYKTYKPNVSSAGVWSLSEVDLKFLAIGCYILGTGGGGSPYAAYLQLRQVLADGHSINLVSCDSLKDDACIVSVGAIGTPAVSIERGGGDEILHALTMMAKELNVKFTHFLASEIGGGNGLSSLTAGSSKHYGLATVDGDLMGNYTHMCLFEFAEANGSQGRAYPAFEMVSRYVHAKSINELLPVTLCSGTGHDVLIPANQTDNTSAGIAIRDICVSMGCVIHSERPMMRLRDY